MDISINKLMPVKEGRERSYILAYRMLNCYEYASDTRVIEYAKQKCKSSWDLYCRNLIALEGKSKKFYLALITATALNTESGIDSYRNWIKSRSSWLIAILFIPLAQIFQIKINQEYESDFNLEEIGEALFVVNVTSVFLSAGWDVNFSGGILAGKEIKNPYSVLVKNLDKNQIQLLKKIYAIPTFDLVRFVFLTKDAQEKKANELSNNMGELENLSEEQLLQVKSRYKLYSSNLFYMKRIANEL